MKLVLNKEHLNSKQIERFFDRFPDLLWDDPEDEFNEIIRIMREKVFDYYKLGDY